MSGFVLKSNAKIKNDRSLRWMKYFIDFTLTQKYQADLQAYSGQWVPPFLFTNTARKHVPNTPGIYLFFIKPNYQVYPEQSFIAYVGYSMNLQSRYEDYLYKYKNSDEPNYYERRLMLNVWEDCLFYTYIPLAGLTEKQIKLLEDKIIDSLVPPINRDFANAIIKQQVRLNR